MIKVKCIICGKDIFTYPHLEKTKKYCSIKCKNIGVSDKLKGRISPQKGKKRKPEWNEKTSRSLKGKMAGEKHPQWKGGISGIRARVYSTIEYKKWRAQIYKRDNWTCQTCNSKSSGNLEAHHIKSLSVIFEENNIKNVEDAVNCDELWNINNGITLCRECHKLTDNYGRKGKSKKIC